MGIKLGNYNIERDKMNWILQEKRVSNPNHPNSKGEVKVRYVEVGYYGKIEHLVNALLNKELLQSDINTLEDIKTTLYQAQNVLKNDVSKVLNQKIWTTEDSI
jgi:hypothetical protein